MTTTIKFLTMCMTIVLLSSFTDKKANEFIGTYGVSSSDPSQIKLTINADHTFYYQDFSVPNKKRVVNGNWSQKGGKVVLKGDGAEQKFHRVWNFVDNGQVAKSRKGLAFYRLCKMEG